MAPIAQFVDSGTLQTARTLLILFLVVLWIALVYYTFADARRRIGDPILVGTATVAALVLPFLGTIVYLIVRPPEYLDDVRERELETRAAEARLAASNVLLCPHCETLVEKDFLRCPSCLRKLKDPCGTCGKPLDPEWRICPFCEAEIPGRTPRRRRRRRPPGEGEGDGAAAATSSERTAAEASRSGERPRAGARTADRPRSDGRPRATERSRPAEPTRTDG